MNGGTEMDVREKLIDLIIDANRTDPEAGSFTEYLADCLINNGVTVQEGARPIEEWNEDFGDVLWWKFPVEEPPYVGSPLDEKWPGYHTHWTFISIPKPPKGDNMQ